MWQADRELRALAVVAACGAGRRAGRRRRARPRHRAGAVGAGAPRGARADLRAAQLRGVARARDSGRRAPAGVEWPRAGGLRASRSPRSRAPPATASATWMPRSASASPAAWRRCRTARALRPDRSRAGARSRRARRRGCSTSRCPPGSGCANSPTGGCAGGSGAPPVPSRGNACRTSRSDGPDAPRRAGTDRGPGPDPRERRRRRRRLPVLRLHRSRGPRARGSLATGPHALRLDHHLAPGDRGVPRRSLDRRCPALVAAPARGRVCGGCADRGAAPRPERRHDQRSPQPRRLVRGRDVLPRRPAHDLRPRLARDAPHRADDRARRRPGVVGAGVPRQRVSLAPARSRSSSPTARSSATASCASRSASRLGVTFLLTSILPLR